MDTTFFIYAVDWLATNPLHALIGLMGTLVVLLTVMLLRVTSRSIAAMERVSEAQLSPRTVLPGSASFGHGSDDRAIPETVRVRATPARTLRNTLPELLDIEESLLGLRELYWRRLIPLDVYARESLKVGSRLKG
jgi:hypothetical protein